MKKIWKRLCVLALVGCLALSSLTLALGEEYTDRETVKAVQEALNGVGYDCGTPDGIAGKRTNEAISDYQSAHGLTASGTVTDELLVALGLKEALVEEAAEAAQGDETPEEAWPTEPVLVAELGKKDAHWVWGTNLLYVRDGDRCYLASPDGTALTESIYDTFFDNGYGFVIARNLGVEGINNRGLLNGDCEEITPYQYGRIFVLSKEWAVGFVLVEGTAADSDDEMWYENEQHYFRIETVDVYNLVSGKCLATFTRDQYLEAAAYGHTINIKDRSTGAVTAYDAEFNVLGTDLDSVYSSNYEAKDVIGFWNDNGRMGLMDAEGNIILEAKYNYIGSFYGSYASVSTDDGNGLIDETGAFVVAPEYDEVFYYYNTDSAYESNGYFGVKKDGKLGYVNADGEVTCEPRLAADALDFRGASASYTDVEGKTHILAGDGRESVVEGYERVSAMDYTGGVFYRVSDADYNYGVIDFHGNTVFPCEYDTLEVSGDGQYVLLRTEYDKPSMIYRLAYPRPGVAYSGEAESDSPAAAALAGVAELLNADAAANAEAVAGQLRAVLAELEAEDPAAALIAGAVALMEQDPAAYGAAAAALVEDARELV